MAGPVPTPIYLTDDEQERYDDLALDFTDEELLEGACCPFTWEVPDDNA